VVELCTNIVINTKLQIGKSGQKTELTGRSPLRRLRAAVDCSVIGEEEEEEIRKRRRRIKVTDWSSVTGKKELEEISRQHI
jgi:hypothetical protein